MTRLSPLHPRFASLRTRALLADALRAGLVVPEGLVAQGRAEAFDYLLGERSTPSARAAAAEAAGWLRAARRPVLSVNGNVAVLAAKEIAALVRARPGLRVEINLFHRTEARARAIAERLRRAGVREVLGVRPAGRLPGLPSDRARIDPRGIGRADLCVIPLEDGDRAEALRRLGRIVIAIDLNPLSRTARAAHLTIVDELRRALARLSAELERPTERRSYRLGRPSAPYLTEALATIRRRLPVAPPLRPWPPPRPARRGGRGRSAERRRSGTGRPRRRTRPR
jgi:4-phosphopantoate---beta-alanine ligase